MLVDPVAHRHVGCNGSFNLKGPIEKLLDGYPLVMTNIAMENRWPIEIDG